MHLPSPTAEGRQKKTLKSIGFGGFVYNPKKTLPLLTIPANSAV